MSDRPRIIAVEGGHGSGKSTLARALADALETWCHTHRAVPGATPWEAACAYAAQRAEVLRSAESEGLEVLVSDRWHWSTAVLGGVLGGPAGMRLARHGALEREEHGDPLLTLVCDAPEDVCRARVEARGETWGEREAAERAEVLRLARLRGWPVIDTTRPRDVVLAEALRIVREVLL